METANTALAEQLFRAISTNDAETVRALCSPDAVLRQNGRPNTTKLDGLLASIAFLHSRITNYRYENPVRVATENGFVEEHDFCATAPDGSEVRIPACVVAVVEDGRLVQMHEYL